MATRKPDPTAQAILAGALAWVIPGAGHFVLGHRGFAAVFFIAITVPYAIGLALGGILDSVNPVTNRWLMVAEIGIGGYTTPCFFASQAIEKHWPTELEKDVTQWVEQRRLEANPPSTAEIAEYRAKQGPVVRAHYMAFFPESDLAQIYLATAGLLNILAILDAIARAQSGGLPTFHRDLQPEPTTEGQA